MVDEEGEWPFAPHMFGIVLHWRTYTNVHTYTRTHAYTPASGVFAAMAPDSSARALLLTGLRNPPPERGCVSECVCVSEWVGE